MAGSLVLLFLLCVGLTSFAQINFANLDIYDASFQFLDDFALQVATAASSYKGNFDRNGFQAVIDTSSVGNEGVSPVDITVDGDDYYGTLILAT
eukprot:gene12045-14231_t